jgi:hypothetical protein
VKKAGDGLHGHSQEDAMPLSDEDRAEIKVIVRKELEGEHKAKTNWRTPFLLGVAVMPLAFAYLLQKSGYPPTSLEWADLLLVSMGIGYLAMFAIGWVMGLANWLSPR